MAAILPRIDEGDEDYHQEESMPSPVGKNKGN